MILTKLYFRKYFKNARKYSFLFFVYDILFDVEVLELKGEYMLKLRHLFDNQDLALMLLGNWEYDKNNMDIEQLLTNLKEEYSQIE
jgi:hypothetical protein